VDSTPANGLQCQIDTTKFGNGTHVLKATVFDTSGASRSDQVSINVQNSTTPTPTPTPTPTSGTATQPPVSGALDLWFKAPVINATVSGVLNMGSSCYIGASGSIGRAAFFLDGTALNVDTTPANGMQCLLDTTKFANGTHTLKATVFDTSGASRSDQVSINIRNGTTATSTQAPVAGALDLWFKAPAIGGTVSGVLNMGSSCYIGASGSIARAAFFLDGVALNTDTTPADGMQCMLDTTKFANGTHTLKATVFDSTGASRSDQMTVNIQNNPI